MGRNLALMVLAYLSFLSVSSLWSFLPLESFRPDLVSIFVTYLALFRRSFGGLMISVVIGWLAGFFQAMPFGLYVVQGLCVFGITRLSTTRLILRQPRYGALYTAFTALFGQAALSATLALFQPSGAMYAKEGLLTLPAVLITTTLVALPLFALLHRMDKRLAPIDRDNYLLGTSRDGFH